MEERRELRKFPRGERCQDCGARRWYLENGLRFCSNGHQVEGFIQFDVGDDADAGKMGRVARKEKGIKEREQRHLTGQAGRNLYLECLQLILRNQLLWLIEKKGHRSELETVVRDLWDLRIRGSSNLELDETGGLASADGGLEMFSSQTVEKEEGSRKESQRARAQSWEPDQGSEWPAPKVLDTLALCHLGCLLLRIPTTVGEFTRWANSEYISYRRAYYDLPQEMRDRLPSAYTKALKMPLKTPLNGIYLHTEVINLALSYHRNYELLFPPLNEAPVIVQYTRELALPVEVAVLTRKIMAALQVSLELPIHKPRRFIIDIPEALLTASIIIATKMCCPLDGAPSLFLSLGTEEVLGISWERWKEVMDEASRPLNEAQFDDITADKITSMSLKELDAYFAHVASALDRRNENPITNFFPSEDAPSLVPPRPEATEEQVEERTKRLIGLIGAGNIPQALEDGMTMNSNKYEAYRSAEDLSEVAQLLYTAAGNLTGLSLDETVRAVYMFEQKLLTWQRERMAT